jgi:hypothetical protein
MSVDPSALARRYAARRLADLSPPLGFPGGSCYLIDRIVDNAPAGAREKLIEKVEMADDLTNQEANVIYDPIKENAPRTQFDRVYLKPHAQYRMDQKGINVKDLRLAIKSFHEAHSKAKSPTSKTHASYKRWEDAIARHKRISWTDPRTNLTIAFDVGPYGGAKRAIVIVTAFWESGARKPGPMDREDCESWEQWSGWSQEYPGTLMERHFGQRSADLFPSLGFPGGRCQVIERIDEEVRNPRLRDNLVDQIEDGKSLSNPSAQKVYKIETEKGPSGTRFKQLRITPHAQYRMDLRGINVQDLKLFFKRFQKAWNDARSRNEPIARVWDSDIAWGTPIEWTDSARLTVVFAVKDRAATIVTTFWDGIPDPRPVDESVCALPSRVASAYAKDAGLKDLWLKWIVQPADVIWKHHKEFVQGPVDDAMDIIIKELAPELVKAIGEQEVEEDIDEFMEGAQKGAWDAGRDYLRDPSGPTEDWTEGYNWGYANPGKVRADLPAGLKRQLVEEAVKEYRRNITEEVIERALRATWDALSPVTTFRAIWAAVKRYGWKLGIVIALVEILETFIIPGVLIKVTGDPAWALAGTLPISEILYAVVFRFLGQVPKEVDEVEEDGHLDWYEERYGVVRIASGSGDCYEANGRYFMDRSIFPGDDKGLRLVHGEVAGQGPLEGVNFGHAWIEDGSTVIDVSNGRNVRIPRVVYYAIGQIDRINNYHVYTPQEFRRKINQYEHWGPWDLKTSTGL